MAVGAPSPADEGEEQREGTSDELAPATGPQHSGRLLVRMPATLHDELARTAEREGVSLNQLITGALAAAVDWRRGDEEAPRTAKAAATSSDPEAGGFWQSSRVTRVALAANFAVVFVAAVIAITLLLFAWRDGF